MSIGDRLAPTDQAGLRQLSASTLPVNCNKLKQGPPKPVGPMQKSLQPLIGSRAILGVVGSLQFDALQSRLHEEYGVPIRYETIAAVAARWVESDTAALERRFMDKHGTMLATDRDGALVLPESTWMLDRTRDDWPNLGFATIRERG